MWYRTDTPTDFGENGVSMRGIWIFSLEDTTRQFVHHTQVAELPLGWSENKRWLYIWAAYDKYLIRTDVSNEAVIDTVAYLPDAYFVELSDDTRKVVYRTLERSRDAWLVENIPAP